MNRRDTVLALITLGVLPLSADAQQTGRVWRIGFLTQRRRPKSIDADFIGAFPRRMRELGYVEGGNLVIEWRFADGRSEQLQEIAEELVRLKVDVLMSGSSQAISAMQKATSVIPIVMATAGDPVGAGFVRSLARPGGNITGLSNLTSDIGSKQLELLLNVTPKAARVAVLINPINPALTSYLARIQAAARARDLTVTTIVARSAPEIVEGLTGIAQNGAQALIVANDSLIIQEYRTIANLALRHRLPSIAQLHEYAEVGGLLSYGPDLAEQFRRAAVYVDRIFKGANPADLPVEQVSTLELVVNGKTATAMGIAIPAELRLRADRVIE